MSTDPDARRPPRPRHLPALLLAAWLAATSAGMASPQGPAGEDLFPGRTYDPDVPSPQEVLGYGPGERHTDYHHLMRYLDALAAASERVTLDVYGHSWEGRELPFLLVSSPANLGRIDEIRADLRRLRDPRGLDDAEAGEILEATPALVHLNYATHGNETSATESSYWFAYELAAATDPETAALLDELVVLLTPVLSPDGHNRFVTWYNANQVGRAGTADPAAAEHFAPWGIDTNNNHYQINPNRESVWSTQAETAAMVRLLQEWPAQVFVDHHGVPEQFIGPWNVEPLHVEITADQRDWMHRYGKAMAAAFEDRGYPYYPWEFGLEYPGYWDSLPIFNGAIAFTLESGGGGWKGLRLRTRNGHVTTFREGVLKNLIADRVTLEVTALARREKLADYLEYRRSAVRDAATRPVKGYVLSADNDPARLGSVVDMLSRNGIEVQRAVEAFRVRGRDYMSDGRPEEETEVPAGSYVLPMAQPQARLLRVLMEPETAFSQEHLDRVRERRELARTAGFLNPNIWSTTEPFYDVTAWSVPHTYGLAAWELATPPAVATEPVTGPVPTPGRLINGGASHAWAISWAGNRAIAAAAWLRRHDVRHRVASAAFRVGEHRFVRGSILVFAHENEHWTSPGHGGVAGSPGAPGAGASARLAAAMGEMAQETGATVVGLDVNLTEEGPNLGSDQFVPVVPGRIAVVRGGPVRPSAYGAIWFLLEHVYGVEFTALEFDDLWRQQLRDYGVVVLPDGFYSGLAPGIEEATAARLRRWMMEGGALVAIKGAAAWAATPELGLTGIRIADPYVGKSIYMTDGGHPPLPTPVTEGDLGAPPEPGDRASEGSAASLEQLATQASPMVHGAVLRTRVYPHHWLSHGYDGEVPVILWSNLVFETGPDVGVPLYYAEAERALIAGFAFQDSLERLEGTGWLMDEPRGRGHAILFADDPNFRLYWDGLTRLFANAVLLSNTF